MKRMAEYGFWWCLDWNAPSIRFYKSLGTEAMTDWIVCRFVGEALKKTD